ncbi:MAG: serpin family protein [Bacteroidetes bacterium]|nr:MAG: serpin family protein [Bacteroidota bacterium]
MQMKYLILTSLCCFLMFSCQEKPASTAQETPKDTISAPEKRVLKPAFASATTSENAKKLAQKSNDFAVGFYQKIKDTQAGKNLFFSPVSLHIGLGMLYLGATNAGRQELETVLGVQNMPNLPEDYYDFQGSIVGEKTQIANALWVSNQDNFKLKTAYQQTLKTNFETDVFTSAPNDKATLDSLNAWVKKATKGNIPQIANTLPDQTKLVLFNAIHFQDFWTEENKFEEEYTKPESFFITPAQPIQVQFMNQRDKRFRYYENDTLQILGLNYTARNSLYVILPTSKMNISTIEQNLSASQIDAWIDQMKPKEAERIAIPKIRMETNFEVNEILKAMGVKAIFNFADTSNLSAVGNIPLFVSKITQKTTLLIDEKGTEASAVTEERKTESKSMAKPSAKFTFIANRPFIFFIKDYEMGAIIFLGRIMNPSETK